MNDTTEEFRARRLDEVSRLVAAKVAPEQRATLQAFVDGYYGQVDPEDLLERQPADLYGAALSHWNFARKRESGHPRVRVFNPSIEEHGWQSTHTIIEIVNDDMPFLVDSVAMEINRHGLTLHLVIHPIVTVEGQDALQVVPESSLGILRDASSKNVNTRFAALPPEVKAYARRPELLIITKSTSRSTVHRPGFLDYIAIKRFNAKGEVCGEDRFLGLFTSAAYSAKPSDIPLLRHKTSNVIRRAHLPPGGHAEKALINILDTYPRDELFQTSEDELLRIATGILHLGD